MPRPDDEVRQLLVHPVVWPPLLSWLKARNIELSAQKFGDGDLPTYVMTPSTVTATTGRDQLDTYVRIFKHLPRETVAELVVAVTTDPDLHGRRTALAQAAMLVSVGHRLGWHDDQPAVVAAVAGETPDTETGAPRSDVGAEFVQRADSPDAAALDLWETDLAQSGVNTPGCDCGHDGMGVRWHDTACAWKVGLVAEARQLVATEERDAETQAHPPTCTWNIESPRRDEWASWGANYDEREWAQERYESAIEHASGRPFRLVRATTTYTVEAEHDPTAASQPGKEA